MADQIIAKSESTYTPAPEGEWDAVCCDVIDLGMVPNAKWGKNEHKVALVFQLSEEDERGKRYEVAERFTVSMHEKARLRQFLSQWRGKSYTEDEARKGTPLHLLEGQPAVVTIEHHKGANDKTYANVLTIRRPSRNDVPLKVNGYTRSEYWKKAQQPVQPAPDDDFPPPIEDEDDIPF